MPLAFDLTSTFVIGVTLPVATTLLAKSPFSTFASFVGSILVPPRVKAKSAPANTNRTAATMPMIMMRLRRFFLPLLLPITSASYRSISFFSPLQLLRRWLGFCSSNAWLGLDPIGHARCIRPETFRNESRDLLPNFYSREDGNQRQTSSHSYSPSYNAFALMEMQVLPLKC